MSGGIDIINNINFNKGADGPVAGFRGKGNLQIDSALLNPSHKGSAVVYNNNLEIVQPKQPLAIAASPLNTQQFYWKLRTIYDNKEFFRDGEKAFLDLINLFSQVDKKAELGKEEVKFIDEIVKRIIEKHEGELLSHLEPVLFNLYSIIYLKTANYDAEENVTIEEVLGEIGGTLKINQRELESGSVGRHPIAPDKRESFSVINNKFISAVQKAQEEISQQKQLTTASPLTVGIVKSKIKEEMDTFLSFTKPYKEKIKDDDWHNELKKLSNGLDTISTYEELTNWIDQAMNFVNKDKDAYNKEYGAAASFAFALFGAGNIAEEGIKIIAAHSDMIDFLGKFKDEINSVARGVGQNGHFSASPLTLEQLKEDLGGIQNSLKELNKILSALSKNGYNSKIQNISNPLSKVINAVRIMKREIDALGEQEEIPIVDILSDFSSLKKDLSEIDLAIKGLVLANNSEDRANIKDNLDGLSTGIVGALSKVEELYSKLKNSLSALAAQTQQEAFPSLTQKRGGLDFTDKIMQDATKLERMGSFADLKMVLPELSNVEAIDLDNEYAQIQVMASSGIRPSDMRILEFITACYYRQEFTQRLSEITACLKEAHSLDEREGKESSQTLQLATMLPDALYANSLN